MAKRKPDKVIEYRISLQDKERELLEHLVYVEGTAKAFNQFTEPFVEIVKDVSAMTLISVPWLHTVAGRLLSVLESIVPSRSTPTLWLNWMLLTKPEKQLGKPPRMRART